MARPYNSKDLTSIEVLILVVLGVFLLAILPAARRKARTDATDTACARNLAELGKAMFVYASDYDGHLPRAGGPSSEWGITAWDAPDRHYAYGLSQSGEGGKATIGTCLYLLVKYTDVASETFVCPQDPAGSVFKLPSSHEARPDFTLVDAWDFGIDPGAHYSYAYHMPFSPHALTTARDPGLAVLADRNPWIMDESFEYYRPDVPPHKGTAKQARAGNTVSHDREGQNVLFLDGHVAFEERPHCGLDNDNIYTMSEQPAVGSPVGNTPLVGVANPRNERDSVLVNERTIYSVTTTNTSPSVNSRDLKRTAVVATLDELWVDQCNVIWCATFQMAWGKLREDSGGDPIAVVGADDLAARLNAAPFATENIEERSYYTAFGPLAGGVLDEIEDVMAQRFPAEQPPYFNERYRDIPDGFIAYASLGIDIGFARPFFTNDDPLTFTDSAGQRDEVASFCAHSRAATQEIKAVREQVEILSYEYADNREDDAFLVDLCKRTQPYQVVLARMPAQETLRQTVEASEQAILTFKEDSDYGVLRKLRPIDRLIVPDVLYRLTHHFTELEGKKLGNTEWAGMPIVEALQTIAFSLSRTGVVLKSRSLMIGASRRGDRSLEEPRHFNFNRPFLIYVKKREPQAEPFFVMWVDNTELLKAYRID